MTDLKQAALLAVNQIREERGMPALAELPCGYSSDYFGCPIAQALDCGACPPTLDFHGDTYEEVRMPEVIVDFVHAFDSGEFPELELEGGGMTINSARAALVDAIENAAVEQTANGAVRAKDYASALQFLHAPEIPDTPVVDERDPDGKVLAWVNEVREKFNLPTLAALPEDYKGISAEGCPRSEGCPIARGINGHGGYAAGWVDSVSGHSPDERRVDYPDFVREFVIEHDQRSIV